MKVRDLFFLALIVYIPFIQVSANDLYFDDSEDDYMQLKRFLFGTKSTSTTSLPTIWTPKPTYPPSGGCASNPCQHDGICTSKGQWIYECKCTGPWRGTTCSISDACYNLPCQNGGTCLNVVDDYWCKCTNDYYGNRCQTKFSSSSNSDSYCRPNICNTGQCVPLKTTYYCQCPDDRYGEHCEKRIWKRGFSKRQGFYKLLEQMKRKLDKQDGSNENKDRGKAYYDYHNGIYF